VKTGLVLVIEEYIQHKVNQGGSVITFPTEAIRLLAPQVKMISLNNTLRKLSLVLRNS